MRDATLAERLNQIIEQQHITKREFARRIGVGDAYIYVITGGGRKNSLNRNISPSLARVIGMEFGYDPEWILGGDYSGDGRVEQLRKKAVKEVEALGPKELLILQEFLKSINPGDH